MSQDGHRTDASRGPRRLVVLRWMMLVLGLIVLGGALGYLLVPSTTVSSDVAVVVDPNALVEQGRARQPMPSVIGLDREVAAAVLQDAGIERAAVSEQAAAGPEGIVLRQLPASGAEVDGQVSLTVSAPGLVPDLAGRTESEASTMLERLGAVVQISRQVNFDVQDGLVIATDPPASTPAPTVVTLVVADAGEAITLSDVNAVDTDCRAHSDSIVNGRTFANSIACRTRAGNVVVAEYALSRNAEVLEATVGTADREGTGSGFITVVGDGQVLATVPVALGQSSPLRVRTAGIMRLRLEVSTDDKKSPPTVVFGDARLVGSKDSIDMLGGNR